MNVENLLPRDIRKIINELQKLLDKQEKSKSIINCKSQYKNVGKVENKNDVVEAKNNILVDDYSGNLYAWESAGGIGVKFSEENKKQQEFITVNSLGELNHTKFMKRLIKRL